MRSETRAILYNDESGQQYIVIQLSTVNNLLIQENEWEDFMEIEVDNIVDRRQELEPHMEGW